MDTGTWHAQLARGHWFSHLPPDLQRSLLGAARLRVLTAGQYLFKRGDPPCGVYAVLEGTVRISAVSAQGKEAVLSLVETPARSGLHKMNDHFSYLTSYDSRL